MEPFHAVGISFELYLTRLSGLGSNKTPVGLACEKVIEAKAPIHMKNERMVLCPCQSNRLQRAGLNDPPDDILVLGKLLMICKVKMAINRNEVSALKPSLLPPSD